jgi:hypothetical protein
MVKIVKRKAKKEEELTMDDMFIKIREIKIKLEEIYECGKNKEEVDISMYVAMIFFIFLHSCEKSEEGEKNEM